MPAALIRPDPSRMTGGRRRCTYALAVPRVSVIVPAYNSATTVAETLASVQAQTFRDWEVIVGDDASTDGTSAAIEALGDPRISLVRQANNGGPAVARNAALEQATGELVAFLDADDTWHPDYLTRQVGRYDAEAARPGSPVGLVACNARIAREDGTFEPKTYLDQFGRRTVDRITVEGLLRRNTVFISCLVPYSEGAAVGWFDPDLFGTEDHDLWLKVMERGRRAVVELEPLATYRRTTSSISRNTARQALNNQRTLAAALRRGRLTASQQRIARSEIRYNRALAAAAGALSARRPPALRTAPDLVWVALSRPGHWREWIRAVKTP